MIERLPRLRRHALIDVAPLRRHRDFPLLFFGQLVTFLGSMLTYVAIPYPLEQASRLPCEAAGTPARSTHPSHSR